MNTLAIALASSLLIACSGSSDHEGAVGTDRMEEGVIQADGTTERDAQNSAQAPTGNATAAGNSAEASANAAEAERTKAAADKDSLQQDLQRLRKELDAELAEVRARLNKGSTDAKQRREDQARAAELAQAIERADRLDRRASSASDDSWAEVRDEVRKELDELRASIEERKEEKAS